MYKFKVGDRVRSISWQKGVTGTITGIVCGGMFEVSADDNNNVTDPFYVRNGRKCFHHFPSQLELINPTREFIVIRRDGQQVIASHKRGDEIIKTAKATCSPSDEFDFGIGAKLAFDRLTGTEKKEEPKPQYVPQVGDRVKTEFGAGTVMSVTACVSGSLVIVTHDTWSNGHNTNRTPKDRALGLSGGRSWYFPPEALRPLNED